MKGKKLQFSGKLKNGRNDAENAGISLDLPAEDGQYVLELETVDEEHGNVLKAWHDLGEPASLNEAERAFLKASAAPWCRTERLDAGKGRLKTEISLSPNAVSYVRLLPVQPGTDEGYDYGWYRTGKERG